jgi:hypothetical protein
MRSALTRRSLVAGLAATAGIAIAGCGQARKPDPGTKGSSQPNPAATAAASAAMTVYRDPSCGCCEAWAKIARDAGYQVEVIDRPDMAAIKAQYGVPDQLLSCHTTIVGGYAIEGHVPLEDVQRLLKEKPRAIRGIAVAGMPLGSPGMEVPDGTKQPFRVMAFDEGGRTSVFRG